MVRLGWFILSVLLLAGCNARDADSKAGTPEKKQTLDKKLQQLAWMEGSWYKEYPTGIMTEAWTMASEHTPGKRWAATLVHTYRQQSKQRQARAL
jgi:hypothetical protein